MKIERGIFPDCSELVARLWTVDSEHELHALLHELEKITDWKVGIQASGPFPQDFGNVAEEVKHCLLGMEKERVNISKSVRIEDVKFGRLFEEDDEVVYNPERLEDPYRTFFKENSWDSQNIHTRVLLLDYEEKNDPKIGDQIDGVQITQSDGYCYAPEILLQAAQHCYTAHFEPLARTIRGLGTDFHCHDGGSSGQFESWCKNHGFSGVARRSRI